MPRLTLNSAIRRDLLLVVALRLAGAPGGWTKLTRRAIAENSKCSEGLVSAHLGSMASIRSLLVKTAIKQENWDILIQALIANDPEAQRMRPLLKEKAFAHVTAGG